VNVTSLILYIMGFEETGNAKVVINTTTRVDFSSERYKDVQFKAM